MPKMTNKYKRAAQRHAHRNAPVGSTAADWPRCFVSSPNASPCLAAADLAPASGARFTEVELAFKELKGDLAVRPIYHQLESRIESHIFIYQLFSLLPASHAQSAAEKMRSRADTASGAGEIRRRADARRASTKETSSTNEKTLSPHRPSGRHGLRGSWSFAMLATMAGKREMNYLPPKMALPTRTRVAPSSMAISKSWLIPMDSTGSGAPPSFSSSSRKLRR
jgi:hypothetical protein